VSTHQRDQPGVVIVGGGAAAQSCIGAYRDHGGDRPITVVSDDDRPPYFRPTLTKEMITDGDGSGSIALADDPAWYAEHDVDLWLSCAATGVDLATHTVGTDHGPVVYESLVLATGSSASSLPVPGADDPRVLRIRRAADSERLLADVSDGRPVLVIGSGFVGCEIAASLRARGLEVTMATMEAAPQTERLGRAVGELIGGWLADLGVSIHAGVQLSSIEHVPGASRARFANGLLLETAHVVVATGARTNVDVARTAGLVSDDAVQVDASMRTAAPGVHAVGDIADALHPLAGRRLRVEHWGDAERMGAVAGAVIAGDHAEWNQVPGFWSQIGGRQLKYVAWGDGHDAQVVRRSADGVTVWYGRKGLCAGVLTYEHDEDLAVGEALIAANAPFPPA
jgi:3-phenylpropionate/trans-cinnamate dioxygenase ferredoxin reductase subunit